MANARVLPRLSDKAPAKRDTTVAGISMEETTNPASDGGRAPKLLVKAGISITGPMVLVSNLVDLLDIGIS